MGSPLIRNFAITALLLSSAELHGQLVHGRLIDDDTDQLVIAGTVWLLDAERRVVSTAVSDSLGMFSFSLRSAGAFHLRVEQLGYRTTTSPSLTLEGGDTISLEIRISSEAILLAPVEVVTSRRPWWETTRPASLWGFLERKERFEQVGLGQFFAREDLVPYDGSPLTYFLSNLPSVGTAVASDGVTRHIFFRGCDGPPDYYLDDRILRLAPGESVDQVLGVAALGGVEVYRSTAQLPAEFGGSRGNCGAIVLWSRRD